jgi:hypothetical protein
MQKTILEVLESRGSRQLKRRKNSVEQRLEEEEKEAD